MASTLEALLLAQTNFLQYPPICTATQATLQTITTATQTAITLDAETFDPYGMHSTSSNPSRVTATVAAWYECSGTVAFVSGTGDRQVGLRVNGTTFVPGSYGALVPGAVVAGVVVPTIPVFLNIGDYVELMGRQASGGNLNTNVGTPATSSLTVAFKHF